MTTRRKMPLTLSTLIWDVHRFETQAANCLANRLGTVQGMHYNMLTTAAADCEGRAAAALDLATLCDELRQTEGFPSIFE